MKYSAQQQQKKISIWYPSLITRNSSRARQPLSRVNVTELLRRLLVKIENIYLFKIIIIIINMETSLKTGFAQIFSCCPKNLRCPNFGGAAAPLAPPPGPYAYENLYLPTISESSCRDWNFRIYPTVFWILPNVAENARRCSDDFLKTSKRFPMIYCKHWLSGHSILDPRALMFLTLRVRSYLPSLAVMRRRALRSRLRPQAQC